MFINFLKASETDREVVKTVNSIVERCSYMSAETERVSYAVCKEGNFKQRFNSTDLTGEKS